MTNKDPSMPEQNNTRVETKHPLVQSIWEMLEQRIPETYVKEVTCVPSTWCRKSNIDAANLRHLGNEAFNLRNFDAAMQYYTQCVATAPVDSEELALAFVNRSAIHLFRKNYELGLLDLNRALDGPIPQCTKQTLLKRKAMTWNKLQEQNSLRSKLSEGISHVKRSDGEKANLKACERKLCYISHVGIDDVDLMIDHSLVDDPIWETKFENTVLKKVSPKIELKYDDRLGPHLVAKDDIEPGETLCIDDLYSLTVNEAWRLDYCDYCQVQCEALIACHDCTRVMYCSNSCREKAYNSYHSTECKMLHLWSNLPDSFRENCLIILRTFLRVTRQGSELSNLMNSPLVRESLDGKLNCVNVQLSHENFPILANVVTRLRHSKYEDTLYYEKIVKEILVIFAGLRYVQFFGNEGREIQCSGNVLNAQEYFGCQLLVYHASLIKPQFFCVADCFVESLAEPYITTKMHSGCAFSLWKCFTALSCDPNALHIVNKRNMLVYSVRSIKAGDQISTMRNAKFTYIPRELRQQLYKNVGGQECDCIACVEDWPILLGLMKSMNKYHIRDENMILEIKKMSQWIYGKQFCSISEDDLKTVLEFSKTVRKYVKEPAGIIHQCESYIEEVMLWKGNLSVDPKYIASLCNDL